MQEKLITHKLTHVSVYMDKNGRYTEMEVKQNGKTEKVNVGGGWGQSFGSMLYLKGNESLGMQIAKRVKTKPIQ